MSQLLIESVREDLVMFSFSLGWFKDLSKLFLSCSVPKLLILAGKVKYTHKKCALKNAQFHL